jgi:hypothetical protein
MNDDNNDIEILNPDTTTSNGAVAEAPKPKGAEVKTPPQEAEKKKQSDSEEGLTLKQVIKEQATEDESPLSSNFTLRKILGGDILNTSAVRRQIWLCLMIAGFIIVYISNRYRCQQKLIEIDNLNKELEDARYKALSTNSQITEKSRESNVLDMLKNNKDSSLHIANQPPYIINVPEE